MHSFQNNFLDRMPLSQNVLTSVRRLGEFKGRQELFERQIPQALESLRQTAMIQSTESSNRIEGVTAPLARIKLIVSDRTDPQNRSEQEIAGYRDVLNAIHKNWYAIPVSNNVILQFHRDLFRYTPVGDAGRWKTSNNEITEKRPDGTVAVRFTPVSAFATSMAMEQLEGEFRHRWELAEIDKLILIPTFVFDFLSIHPFLDGNGRIARLISLLLLYKAGYSVGRIISLEKIIEESKESYYESLARSSALWHEGRHNLLPWVEYFLGVLTAAYRDFESRIEGLTTTRGAKTAMILQALRNLPDSFQLIDLERACPNVSRDMIRKVFGKLKKDGKLKCEGRGPNAPWRKIGAI